MKLEHFLNEYIMITQKMVIVCILASSSRERVEYCYRNAYRVSAQPS